MERLINRMHKDQAFDADKMYCGKIKRGEVFLIADGEGEKAGVVLQDDILNERLSTVAVAPLAPYKKGEKVFKNEVLLKSAETGLGQDGICLLHKLGAVERQRLMAKKGELKKEKLAEVYEALDMNCGRFRD